MEGEVSVQLSSDTGRAALWVERKSYLKMTCVVYAQFLNAGTKPETLNTLVALLGKIRILKYEQKYFPKKYFREEELQILV